MILVVLMATTGPVSDSSTVPQRITAVRAKPKAGVDGCYDRATPPVFFAEQRISSSEPVSKSSVLYPVYSNVRHKAGGPLAANVLNCDLKPVDARDYGVPFTGPELARLKEIFPGWCVRLVEAGRQPGAGGDLGIVRPVTT
jgi:hypothetical protein